jgi:hypothetical protein
VAHSARSAEPGFGLGGEAMWSYMTLNYRPPDPGN